jgi:hypothetical protein
MALPYAASFSGSNYLNISNYTGNPAALSVSCWVYLNATQLSRIFFSDYNNSTGAGWAVGISDSTNNQVKFYFGSSTLFQTGTLSNATWTHVVFTHDGTTGKIYLNGNTTPSNTLTAGLTYNGTPTSNYIGTLQGVNQMLNGRLAGVGYWSKALSTTEVSSLYAGGNGLSYSELSGSLLTSLVSYHEFNNASSLGTDSSGNGHTYTNTGSVVQAFGPYTSEFLYTGLTQRPYHPILQPRWSRGMVRGQVVPWLGAVAKDLVDSNVYSITGSMAWSRNAYGPCLNPNDSTGQGCLNWATPIPAGATAFTLVALASLDTTTGGGSGLRHLWGAEGVSTDMRLALSGGSLIFQLGADGTYTNLGVLPPPLNVPVLITVRLAAGVRTIWYGPYKVAERTDAGITWGSSGNALGLGSSPGATSRNWSGQINGAIATTLAFSDAQIVDLAADFFALARPLRQSPAILRAALPPSDASLAPTEGADAFAGAGLLTIPGSLALTETIDALAASGAFAAGGLLAPTEATDLLSGSGGLATAAALAGIELGDLLAGSGGLAIPASLAVVEGLDILATSAGSSVAGSAGVVGLIELGDIGAMPAARSSDAVLGAIEANDIGAMPADRGSGAILILGELGDHLVTTNAAGGSATGPNISGLGSPGQAPANYSF